MAILIILLAALMLVLGVLVFLVTAPTEGGPAVEGFLAAHRLGADVDTRRAVSRYVSRTRDFARRGMVLGLLASVVLGVAWYQQITAGYGASPLGDLVTMGLGGWFVGLLLSARYWRTPTGTGPRAAPLTPRDADRYRSPALARAMAVVAGLSGALGVASLLPGDGTERAAVATLGLLTIAALAWAARTQWRIARRPQPFVTADLLAADEAMRVTSARVIGLAAIGVGLVVIGWQAAFVVRALAAGSDVGWTALLPMAPLVAGLVVAIRARRLIHPRARVTRSAVAA